MPRLRLKLVRMRIRSVILIKNALIAVLCVVVLVLSYRLARVENQRYALLIGMCSSSTSPIIIDVKCLETVRTRTQWVWHLYYGIRG